MDFCVRINVLLLKMPSVEDYNCKTILLNLPQAYDSCTDLGKHNALFLQVETTQNWKKVRKEMFWHGDEIK